MIGIIILVLLAVLGNFIFTHMRRARAPQKTAEILSPEMRRAVTGIDISVNREGEARSRIRARELLETREGKSLLSGIEAWDIGEDGGVQNEIRSLRAEYDPERRTAYFTGDVRVFLRGDTEVRTESLRYDWNSGIGETPDPLEFFYGKSAGRARGIRFDRGRRTLDLQSNVELVYQEPGGVGKIRASADKAYFSEESLEAVFHGNARVKSETAVLAAEELTILAHPDRKGLKSVTADGGASYESADAGAVRRIRGRRMIFELRPSGGRLEKISVLDGAEFHLRYSEGERTLNGAEILVDMDPAGSIPATVTARGDVRFSLTGISERTDLSGERLAATFVPGTENLESLRVEGRAAMSAKGKAEAPGQSLRADDIQIFFRPLAGKTAPEKLRAEGSVSWILESAGTRAAAGREPSRTLEAFLLEMSYSREGDSLDSGRASGGVVVKEVSSGERDAARVRRLSAEKLRFDFFRGSNRIRSLDAEGNVQIAYEGAAGSSSLPGAERFVSESDRLQARFYLVEGESALRTASQWGHFRYRDAAWTATARRSDYDALKGLLVLEGSPRIASEETGVTTGERAEYDRKAMVVSVHGKVRSKLAAARDRSFLGTSSSSPGVITAQTLQYWTKTKLARYSGDVRLLSEDGQLHAGILEISGNGERVEARDDVMHLVPADEGSDNGRAPGSSKVESKPGGMPIIIKSSAMKYLKEKNTLTYTGGVRLRHKDLTLSSGSLEAVLNQAGRRVESAEARDHVVLHHLNRECKGDAAFYYLDPGKFVVIGEPAEINDPGKGRSLAGRLTSFTADDRILIEGR